jgi:hypothetical protein
MMLIVSPSFPMDQLIEAEASFVLNSIGFKV